jgi:hypothetical protein
LLVFPGPGDQVIRGLGGEAGVGENGHDAPSEQGQGIRDCDPDTHRRSRLQYGWGVLILNERQELCQHFVGAPPSLAEYCHRLCVIDLRTVGFVAWS